MTRRGSTLLNGLVVGVLVCPLACQSGRLFGSNFGCFDERACAGETFSLPEAFLPQFDYAELRESNGGRESSVISIAGRKCGGAKDAALCEGRVREASATRGWSNGSHGRMPGHHYVVATRGDEVVVVDEHTKSLRSALAPIDSPTKAAAVAAIDRNITPSCKQSVRRVGNAFEVHLKSDSCFGPAEETVRVDASGAITVVRTERGERICVGFNETPARRRRTGTDRLNAQALSAR